MVERQLPALDGRVLPWGDLLRTGIDERRLRNSMKRDLIDLGAKFVGRLVFSFRELFMADVLHALNGTGVTVGTAAMAAKRVGPDLEMLIAAYNKRREAGDEVGELRLCVRRVDKTVLVFYIDADGSLPGKVSVPVLAKWPDYPAASMSVDDVIGRLIVQMRRHEA